MELKELNLSNSLNMDKNIDELNESVKDNKFLLMKLKNSNMFLDEKKHKILEELSNIKSSLHYFSEQIEKTEEELYENLTKIKILKEVKNILGE